MTDAMQNLTWSTEQRNPRTMHIDQASTEGIVGAILDEDALVAPAVQAVAPQIAAAVDLAVSALSSGGRLRYVGAGTSGRLGVLDAVELFPTYGVGAEWVQANIAGGDAALTSAIEGAEDDEELGRAVLDEAGPHDLVVGIAASGRTPYVAGALRAARERGLSTVLISSNPHAPLAESADIAILPDTGPEAVTGSTRMKSGTAQKLVLNAMSTAVMIRMGKTYSNLMINVIPTNEKLRRRVVNLLQQATGLPLDTCERIAVDAAGDLRLALVALLGDVPVSVAAQALLGVPIDPERTGDPAGVRTALARLR